MSGRLASRSVMSRIGFMFIVCSVCLLYYPCHTSSWNPIIVENCGYDFKMAVVGSQFSTGDQSQSVREAFWASGYRQCLKCPLQDSGSSKPGGSTSSTIKSEDHVAGCRFNGDAYGTTVFRCSSCQWQTSFQYDEASETYYYETQYWTRPDPNAPPKPQHPWSGFSLTEWLASLDKDIVDKCLSSGLLSDGPTLSEMTLRHFKALSFTKQESQLLVQVIGEKNKELGL